MPAAVVPPIQAPAPVPVAAASTAADTAADFAVRGYGLHKVYGRGDASVAALADVTVGLERGRFTAVMGPSGSGKSTLLHLLAGLDVATAGRAFIDEVELGRLRDADLTRLRRDRVGFVFQSFNLIPTLSAAENIRLPLDLAGRRPDPVWWDHVIASVGLRDRLDHRPAELSGGQQQRVAVARALITRPSVVFADEPTGNLDAQSSADVLGLLRDAVTAAGQTVVMVTHDVNAAAVADRVVVLRDGRISQDLARPTLDAVVAAVTARGASHV